MINIYIFYREMHKTNEIPLIKIVLFINNDHTYATLTQFSHFKTKNMIKIAVL